MDLKPKLSHNVLITELLPLYHLYITWHLIIHYGTLVSLKCCLAINNTLWHACIYVYCQKINNKLWVSCIRVYCLEMKNKKWWHHYILVYCLALNNAVWHSYITYILPGISNILWHSCISCKYPATFI